MSTTTTGISWTDRTWNPVRGCSRVSTGCKNCYAESVAYRFSGPGKPFEGLAHKVNGHPAWTGKVVTVESALLEPLSWKQPQRIFVNSMSDLFHEDVPDAFIDQVFAVMALAPQHTFQILTKRAERMRSYLTGTVDGSGVAARIAAAAQVVCGFDGQSSYDGSKAAKCGRFLVLPDADVFWIGSCNPPDQPYRERWILKTWPLKSVWLGVSVEDQQRADERIPLLLQTPAAVRFISAEPLLSAVDLRFGQGFCRACKQITAGTITGHCFDPQSPCFAGEMVIGDGIDWVIVGGESGPGARPMNLAWARSIVQQCKAAGVACFLKQLGSRPVVADGSPDARFTMAQGLRVDDGGNVHLRDRKGGSPEEWPADLQGLRQFPTVAR